MYVRYISDKEDAIWRGRWACQEGPRAQQGKNVQFGEGLLRYDVGDRPRMGVSDTQDAEG